MTDSRKPEPVPKQIDFEEVFLDSKVQQETGTITESQAKTRGILADIKFRGWMLVVVATLFLSLNFAVIWLIHNAFVHDLNLPPASRLVTEKVLISLIGATVVQTGLGFISILSYLFPKK